MRSLKSIRKARTAILVFTLLASCLAYRVTVHARPDCDAASLSDCSYPCFEDGFELKPDSWSGTWRECPKYWKFSGGACGVYWPYDHLEGGQPICIDENTWNSDYEFLSANCTRAIGHDILDFYVRELVTFGKGHRERPWQP